MPKYITTDFEKGLIKAINYEFPESKIIGCYFHFKQKLIKYNRVAQNIETILVNSELTENFANAHPNLAAFVEVIRKEFKYYEERITEIRQYGSGIRYEFPEKEKKHNNSRI
ncbi:hypothetical protein HZS_4401 [Henneguya salminicola]|nr:hypothetical protein HZS_4401 [Henneguya salminicola]